MKTFDDSYIIQKRLGRGGFGVVHQVQEKKTHDLYAIKEVPYSPEMTERERARQDTELKILTRANHENVVKFHEHFLQDGKVLLLLELCSRGDMRAAIRVQMNTGQPFTVEQRAKWFLNIANGLDHLHGLKIIHRDIKPANILLSDTGSAKLTDFGVSKLKGLLFYIFKLR